MLRIYNTESLISGFQREFGFRIISLSQKHQSKHEHILPQSEQPRKSRVETRHDPVVCGRTGYGSIGERFIGLLEWLAALGNAEGMNEWIEDSEVARILAGRLRNDQA